MSMHDDLKAYLDGELDSVRAEEVRSALDNDPALRQALSEIQALSVSIKSYANEFSPQGLEQTLKALGKQSKSRVLWTRPWGWVGGIGLATVLLAVVLVPLVEEGRLGSQADSAKTDSPKNSVAAAPVGPASTIETMKAATTRPSQPLQKTAVRAGESRRRLVAKAEPRKPHSNIDGIYFRREQFAPAQGTVKLSGKKRPASTNPTKTLRAGPGIAMDKSNQPRIGQTPGAATPALSRSDSETKGQVGAATLLLTFQSKDTGFKKVMAMVGQFEVQQDAATVKDFNTIPQNGPRTIAVDLPEDLADQIVVNLKSLQTETTKLETVAPGGTSTSAGSLGPGSFGGGRGGRAMGGFGGSLRPPRDANGQVLKKSTTDGEIAAKNSAAKKTDGDTVNHGSRGRASGAKLANEAADRARAKVPATRSIAAEPAKPAGKPAKTRRVIIVIQEKPGQMPVP